MLKKIVVILSVVVIIFGVGVLGFYKFQQLNHSYLGINPEKLPRVITDKILEKHNSERETTYGFSGKNIEQKDMSQVSLSVISNISLIKVQNGLQRINYQRDLILVYLLI
jgi:hypothetical protein